MSSGKIVQVIGAVIDVEFPRDQIPRVYQALKLDDVELTLEVQQQLGDGVVRTIAMGSSEGLKRGMGVKNTGAPISVPVGLGTLGRIMLIAPVQVGSNATIGAGSVITKPAPAGKLTLERGKQVTIENWQAPVKKKPET